MRILDFDVGNLDASDFRFGDDSLPENLQTVFYVRGGNIDLQGGMDAFIGNSEDNIIKGGAGADLIVGGQGNDTLYGGEDGDRLEGGEGDDTLYGGSGTDWLIGGEGDDTLTGGADADTFVVAAGHGDDTITDFTDGEDLIDLTAFQGIDGFEDLTITAEGTAAVIDLSEYGGGTIRLENFEATNLDAEDFNFHEPSVDPGVEGI